MTTTAPPRLDLSQMKPIDPSRLMVRKMSPEEETAFRLEEKRLIEQMFTRPVGRTGYGDYARVVKGGKVVAILDNTGGASMSNGLGALLGAKLPNDGEGPELADRRAKLIAELTGGDVVVEQTAMSVSEWNQREPIKTAVDFAAMTRDGFYGRWQELSQPATTSSRLNAQLLGQGEKVA